MEELPVESTSDNWHEGAKALAKGALGAVPIAGSLLSEVVDILYREPIEERRDNWLRDLAATLEEIRRQQDELTPDRLASNPEFITVLHRATRIAVETHERAKHRELQSALIHAASPQPLDVDKQLYFLGLIGELTVNQVLVLRLYREPRKWFQDRGVVPQEFHMGGRDQVVKQAYPELAASEFFSEMILDNLVQRGLLMSGFGATVTGHAVYDAMTTPLANQFLDYVSSDAPTD